MNGFFPKWRIIVFSVLTSLMVAALLVRYARLSAAQPERVAQKVPAVERGSIVDRNGKPLAVDTNFFHMGINPQKIKNPEDFARDVAPALEMSQDEILGIIRKALEKKNSRFAYLKKKMPLTTYEAVKKITDQKQYRAAVSYDKIPGRIYPENTLASQLIGYMGDDGKGLAGIEYSMQPILQPQAKAGDTKPEQGKNVYLTIDAGKNARLQLDAFGRLRQDRRNFGLP